MVTTAVHEAAKELPTHQTSRGQEFREIPLEDRVGMARAAVIARCQVNSTNADWNNVRFRKAMSDKKSRYFYHAGKLGISVKEAKHIWWQYVHDDPTPIEKNSKGLI